jgi:hypothetical protein
MNFFQSFLGINEFGHSLVEVVANGLTGEEQIKKLQLLPSSSSSLVLKQQIYDRKHSLVAGKKYSVVVAPINTENHPTCSFVRRQICRYYGPDKGHTVAEIACLLAEVITPSRMIDNKWEYVVVLHKPIHVGGYGRDYCHLLILSLGDCGVEDPRPYLGAIVCPNHYYLPDFFRAQTQITGRSVCFARVVQNL